MANTAAGAGALVGAGGMLLVWQITLDSPRWYLVALGIIIVMLGGAGWWDANFEEEERQRHEEERA